MRKLSFCVLATAGIAVGIVACRKGADKMADNTFNTAAAKEWYYGTFKKSAAWSGSSLNGKKLPEWKNGVYSKIGDMEIAEFPLVAAKKFISVQSGTASRAQQEQMADASLTRIVFAKRGNAEVAVRELTFIPDARYVQQRGFDVSDATLVEGKGDFTGRVIVKDWSGKILKRWYMENGVITKRGHLKAMNTAATSKAASECMTIEICEYEQICTEYWSGDVLIEETCDPWTATGNCWYEEYCEDMPCTGSETECACSNLGICEDDGGGGGGGGDDDEECNLPSPSEVLAGSTSVTEPVDEQTGSPVTTGGVQTRTWWAKWHFYKGHWTFYTWHYMSWDEGTHKWDGSAWKWETLTHKSESQVGTSPFTTTLTMNRTESVFNTDKSRGTMKLFYDVKMCVDCVGVPMGCHSEPGYGENTWPAQ